MRDAAAKSAGILLGGKAGGAVEPVWVEPRKHLLIVQPDQPTVLECKSAGRVETVHLPRSARTVAVK